MQFKLFAIILFFFFIFKKYFNKKLSNMFQKFSFKEAFSFSISVLNAAIFYRTVNLSNEIKQNSEKLIEISNNLLKHSSFSSVNVDEQLANLLANSPLNIDEMEKVNSVSNQSIWEFIHNSPYLWYSMGIGCIFLICFTSHYFVANILEETASHEVSFKPHYLLHLDCALQNIDDEKIEVFEKISEVIQ